MRTDISPAIKEAHPDIEDILWNAAVYAKYEDWDIRLMGLHVRVTKATDPKHWAGWAHPHEDSRFYRSRLIHPAGRIDLRVGVEVPELDIVRLMAHELRHIGQFHRGRKIRGYLTTEWMQEQDVEPDCYAFEDEIVGKYARLSCAGYKRPDYLNRKGCVKPGVVR